MKSKALVVYEKNGPFMLDEIDLDMPGPGEVLVRIAASGLCHTDILAREKGAIPFPIVLGHEGAGVVEALGPGVDYCQVGDHVLLSYNHCELCPSCRSGNTGACVDMLSLNFRGVQKGGGTRLHQNGKPVSTYFGQSSFAHYAVTNRSNTVVIPRDVPVELFGPLGCGIQTGSGAVFYKLHPYPGDSIAVFGCGSVGLAAVLAAKACGCTEIVAVDVFDGKLELAKTLGATHTINAKTSDVIVEIEKICKGGVCNAVETTGSGSVLSQSLLCVAPGGKTCAVGSAHEATFNIDMLRCERSVVGVTEGTLDPHLQIPRLIELWRRGMFPFDRFVTFYDMKEMDKALDDMENGRVVKAVIRMN